MRALEQLRSLPNLISISRLLLAGVFVAFDRTDVRIVVVALASASDYLDGLIARRSGSMSRFGAMLDASADRFFMLVVISVLLFDGALTTLGYFTMLIRDLMNAVGFLTAQVMPSLRG